MAAIKTAMLGIRLKPEVREHLVRLARADGRPLSQYVVERVIMPHLAAFPEPSHAPTRRKPRA